MPKETTKKTPTNVSTEPHPNLEEEIGRRAYELYQFRGQEDGHDLDDWLLAEDEILGSAVKTAAASSSPGTYTRAPEHPRGVFISDKS